MADVKISGLPTASALGVSDVVPVVQASTTKQATMTQVATSVFSQNGVVSSLPAAGTLLTTDITNVVAGGVASQASMTQIATSVYANNTGLTTLPNATSVTSTDTTVVAQSGTNREATIQQVANSVMGNSTAITSQTATATPNISSSFVISESGTNKSTSLFSAGKVIVNYPSVISNISSSGFTPAQIYDYTGAIGYNTANTSDPNISAVSYDTNAVLVKRVSGYYKSWDTVQLIGAMARIPLNTSASYAIYASNNFGTSYTNGYAVIQSSTYGGTTGASAALPTTGSAARIRLMGDGITNNDDIFMDFNLLNFNSTTYGTSALIQHPVYKVPFKYQRGTLVTVGTSTATCTGSIAGNIMTVTAGPTGTAQRIVPGATVTGTGVSAGTNIVEQITITTAPGGSTGTYLVNTAQTVTSTTLTCSGIDSSISMYNHEGDFLNGTTVITVSDTNYTSGTIDIFLYGTALLQRTT